MIAPALAVLGTIISELGTVFTTWKLADYYTDYNTKRNEHYLDYLKYTNDKDLAWKMATQDAWNDTSDTAFKDLANIGKFFTVTPTWLNTLKNGLITLFQNFDKMPGLVDALKNNPYPYTPYPPGLAPMPPLNEMQDKFNQAKSASIPVDPLLIDLDRDGIETTSINNGTYFDHNKDGFAERTGWVGEDDGILVIDKNNDGVINNGNEIFGDNYVKSNGTTATNGFDALKDLDTNNDNIINTNDTAFSSLKIAKGDGTLLTLAEAGISSINLGYSNTNTTDANGNTQIHIGSYTKINGTTAQIADYNLQVNKTYSIATEWVTESESIQALPDIQGFGTVYSLHQAMARDTQLQALVEAFVAEPTLSQKHTLLNQILVKWSGCEGVASDSRGTFIDGQKLAV